MVLWFVVYVVTSVQSPGSPTERCRVTVATQVPVMTTENTRPASMPVTRIGSENVLSATADTDTVCPRDATRNSEPTFVLRKYGFDAVRVVLPVSAAAVRVIVVLLPFRNGPSSDM